MVKYEDKKTMFTEDESRKLTGMASGNVFIWSQQHLIFKSHTF
jgi:hypothetical protein